MRSSPALPGSSCTRCLPARPQGSPGGVTSGVFGALRLVQQLAGAAEAQRVGRELAYPGWSLDGPTGIPAHRPAPRDLINLLAGRATARVTAKSIEYQDHGVVAGTVTC